MVDEIQTDIAELLIKCAVMDRDKKYYQLARERLMSHSLTMIDVGCDVKVCLALLAMRSKKLYSIYQKDGKLHVPKLLAMEINLMPLGTYSKLDLYCSMIQHKVSGAQIDYKLLTHKDIVSYAQQCINPIKKGFEILNQMAANWIYLAKLYDPLIWALCDKSDARMFSQLLKSAKKKIHKAIKAMEPDHALLATQEKIIAYLKGDDTIYSYDVAIDIKSFVEGKTNLYCEKN